MKNYLKLVIRCCAVLLFCCCGFAEPNEKFFENNQFYGSFEYGFVGFVNHSIQFGKSGTKFDYVNDGNQRVLFPNWRIKVGAQFVKRHKIEILYQPIFVSTTIAPKKKWQVDDTVFPSGTPVESTYNFPFYRLSYTYDIIHGPKARFAIGGGLQIRNATISFASLDGKQLFETQSLGPVPLFALAYGYKFNSSFYISTETTGFWAPIRYLNGGNTDIEGWIYEAEIESGFELMSWMDGYANIRLLGGGNRGSSSKSRPSGGKFSENILNTLSLNIGFRFKTRKY